MTTDNINKHINSKVFNSFPVLQTERLILREMTIEDVKFINHIKSDPKLLSYMDKKPHTSLDESKSLWQEMMLNFKKGLAINWILMDKKTSEPLGDCGIWRLDFRNARGEIGYTLIEKAWGKGFMSEALSSILDFAFNQLNLHSIEANINPLNSGSRKLLLSNHFRKEAYFSENYYFDGKFLDSEIYSLLKNWHIQK